MAENNEEEYLDELLNSFRNNNTDGHEDEVAVTDEGMKSSEVEMQPDVDLTDEQQDADLAADIFLTDDALGDVFGDAPADDIMDMPVLEENNDEEVSQNVGTEADEAQDEIADIFALEDNTDNNAYQEEVQNDSEEQDYHESEPEQDSSTEENDVGLMDLLKELGGDTKESVGSSGAKAEDAGTAVDDEKKSGGKRKGLFGKKKAADADSASEGTQDKAAAAKKEKEEKKALKKAEKLAKKQQKADKKKAKGKNVNNKNNENDENNENNDNIDNIFDNVEGAESLIEAEVASQDNMDLINALYDEPEVQEVTLDEAEELEDIKEPKKKEKKPKKEKKKKAPKPKKEKKPKKDKRPPRPSELVKVTPFTFLGIIIFTVAITALVMITTKLVSYNSSISAAKTFFDNGKYEQAFDSIAGLELKDKDLDTYYKIRAVMSIYADYSSYINYRKVDMMVEALDSLINGLEHYDMYHADAEKYEVLTQYDGVRELIVSALAEYGVSVEDALYYGGLENEEQYIEILQNIGGTQQ